MGFGRNLPMQRQDGVLVRNAGTAGVNATLHIAAGMQYVYAIWGGAFPEADAAIALVGDWVRIDTGEFAT